MKWFGFVLCLAVIVACGKSEETSTGVPTPEPTPPVPEPVQVEPAPTRDPRLPYWIDVVSPIRLAESRNYSGLEDLFGVIYPPVVGDPIVAMELAGNRERTVEGKLFLGFEDTKGFAYLEVPTVNTMGYRDSGFFDGYFADDEGVLRVSGSIKNNILSGQLYYRNRANQETQCTEWIHCGWVLGRYQCQASLDQLACQNYMSTSNTAVKLLGNFDADYLKWFLVNE